MPILSIIKDGLSINFAQIPEARCPFSYFRIPKEIEVINKEIIKRSSRGVIIPTTAESNNYFSNVFKREKLGISFQMILNIKRRRHQSVIIIRFKMKSICNVIHIKTPGWHQQTLKILFTQFL